MPDHEAVTALIHRVVAGARIPSRAEREDLCRELWTHFEDAAASADDIPMAIRRFGSEAVVADSFRRVYRFDYFVLYSLKIAASIAASIGAALIIQVLVNLRAFNLRVGEPWGVAPQYWHAVVMSVAIVLGLVTAREIGRRRITRSAVAAAIAVYAAAWAVLALTFVAGMVSFALATLLVALGCACSKLERPAPRLGAAFGAFAATIYLTHLALSVTLDVTRTALSSGAYVAIWATTVAIWARLDVAFASMLGHAARRAV